MRRRRFRAGHTVLGLVAAAAAALVAGALLTGSGQTNVLGSEEGEYPPALGAHLEQLKQTIPGNGGESAEGPGSAGADWFYARAYPDNDIPLARANAARRAYVSIADKGLRSAVPGTWTAIGPSKAVYELFGPRDFRSYVPNRYVAAGRTTAMAIDPNCTETRCRIWIGAAGGGIWRTDNAFAEEPTWAHVSTSFEMSSTGSITIDPNDSSGNTIWVGTGEPNSCGNCLAGVGLYKSTDGGSSWTGPIGESVFRLRGVGSIAIEPGNSNTIYAASGRAVMGIASTSGAGVSIIPGAPKWGLYKSTDGGANWTFIHNGSEDEGQCTGDATEAANGTPCSPRGVRKVVLDPTDSETLYAASYARGVWRSNDGGANWTEIKPSLDRTNTTTRPELAVTTLDNGDTRLYVAEGSQGNPYSRLFRSDDTRTGTPTFNDLSSSDPASPGYGSYNYCTGQCWYDNLVYTPPGHPDIVYLGGSYLYNETGRISNGRGILLSTDGGVSFTDLTMDATDPVHPNGMHPDQHFVVTVPDNPMRAFAASDGGIVRTSGEFADISANCDTRGLSGAMLDRCKQLLSRVPTLIEDINTGLMTLQFVSLSVNPRDYHNVQGGTQDNGTWESPGSKSKGNKFRWPQSMIGDGGQSGFDSQIPRFRFHTFFQAQVDVNFSGGDVADWNWISDPLLGEPQAFYVPIISDPKVSRTMYVGTSHVWRTKTHGMGSMTIQELRQHCNEWTGDFAVTCGDWEPLGDPGAAGWLTDASWGDRPGGFVAGVERTAADKSTLWASTSTGRVFVSHNANADPASSVAFTRIDTLSTRDPGRFVTGIYIDPANPNHAWLSYSGFNATTPNEPGHVFEVTYDPSAGTATWTSIDGSLGDLPLTDIVRDDVTGDFYVSNDFGVLREPAGGGIDWGLAAPGMPAVQVSGLTLGPERRLFAATHGLSAWRLTFPS
jgi:hypothetical protein